MPMLDRELSVGALSRRSGLPVSTLHFYEAEGLIHANRTRANHRRYPRATLRRVAVIKVAQRLGLPLAQIREAFAAVPDGRTPTPEDWANLSAVWRDDLDARIAMLTALRDQLGRCIGCGCMSFSRCPLYNPDDELAEAGPGAHRLGTEDAD